MHSSWQRWRWSRARRASTANSTRDRTISLYNIHTKETLTIQYMKGGKRIPEAMEKINWILRDWRKDETTEMDPDLIDLIWEIHNELGSAEPIHIISGYRSRATNEMLRKTVGGQASQSRHILGKAADVHFPDVPVKQAALLRADPRARRRRLLSDLGHPVRAPRYRPRARLAAPAARRAGAAVPQRPHPARAGRRRADHQGRRAPGRARQHGAGHADRRLPRAAQRSPRRRCQVASLTPSLPQLLSPPRLDRAAAAVSARTRATASAPGSRRWRLRPAARVCWRRRLRPCAPAVLTT